MHKSTLKKAVKLGIKLVEKDGEFVATWKRFSAKSKKNERDVLKQMIVIQQGQSEAADEESEFPSLAALQDAKPEYKKRGDINNCGDWLALVLKEQFLTTETTEEGRVTSFDVEAFTECLEANGVPVREGRRFLPFANRRTPGWQGRFRMNGRQKLEVIVAEKGTIKLGSKRITAPRAALSDLRRKHPQD